MTTTVKKVKVRLPAIERRAAEANARETQRLEDEQEALKAWPNRLMTNLNRAAQYGLDITVNNMKFAVRGVTGWNEYITFYFGYLPTTPYDQYYNEGDWEMMSGLERHLDDMEKAKLEEQRKREAKEYALAKLTPEDKKALGL